MVPALIRTLILFFALSATNVFAQETSPNYPLGPGDDRTQMPFQACPDLRLFQPAVAA